MKSRFCPSPTGHMHVGNLRTAYFNFLAACADEGIFLLRIEDTDRSRSYGHLAEELMTDLQWLGIEWQEGPKIGGENGSYWQSERDDIYAQYYEKLLEQNQAYFCFCSETELTLQRKIQASRGLPPRYPGTCRNLTDSEIAERKAAGIPATLRFKIPSNQEVVFEDVVKGQQIFQTDDIGDFIIRRADGSASFLFCNAVDDALMKVTLALRGEDHLSNTPRQLLIAKALGLTPPQYGHISLILGNDGAPLSKRNGSLSVAELRADGFLPEGILNYLARLGHYYEQTAWLTPQELAMFFKIKNLGVAPARFDEIQLKHWQHEAVLRLDAASFWSWCGEDVSRLVPDELHELFFKSLKGNILFPSDAKEWAKILYGEFKLNDTIINELKTVNKNYFIKAVELWGKIEFKSLIQELSTSLNLKGKALFSPLRLALTGRKDGPELSALQELLTYSEAIKRLSEAADAIG